MLKQDVAKVWVRWSSGMLLLALAGSLGYAAPRAQRPVAADRDVKAAGPPRVRSRAVPSGRNAASRDGLLGFLMEGEPTGEVEAALAWARERYNVVVLNPGADGRFLDESGKPRPLSEFSVLWWHCQMRSVREMAPWYSHFTKEPTLRAMTDYLVRGGGLYLSGSGARYLTYLGLEPYYPTMGATSEGPGRDCGYEILARDHPIFRGLPDPLIVKHMSREESGTCGYFVDAIQENPLAYAYLIGYRRGRTKRRYSVTPLARWAGLDEDRIILAETPRELPGKVIVNGPYFYLFHDKSDPHYGNLSRLTENILRYLRRSGPMETAPDPELAETIAWRRGTAWRVRKYVDENMDPLEFFFDFSTLTDRRIGLSGYGTSPWPPTERLEKTIGVSAERGRAYIAGDIKYNPVVSMYAYPQCPSLFPVCSNAGILHWRCYDARLYPDDEAVARDLRDSIEFVLWAQYDADGVSPFLRETGQMEFPNGKGDPRWAYGWPYMNFDWDDRLGYHWKAFEPFHHTTPAYALVQAYEITGDRRCLEAARNFLLHHCPNYGPDNGFHTIEWRGKKAYWMGYHPMVKDLPSTDAVDNVQTLLAEVYAAVGYHTKDAEMLERARGLLRYVCRELATDGEWYYYGIDSPLYGRNCRSHFSAVLGMGMDALAYLAAAGVDVSDIVPWFRLGALHLNAFGAPSLWGFSHASAKLIAQPVLDRLSAAEGQEVEFVHWVRVYDVQARRVLLKDTLPEGFEVPGRIELTIEDRKGARRVSVAPDQLREGVELSNDCRAGEHLVARYSLRVADITKVKENPPGSVVIEGIERMRGPGATVVSEKATKYVQGFFRLHRVHGGNFRDAGVRYAPPLALP